MDLAGAKKTFFDRKQVTDRLDPAIKKALSRFGAFVRQRARSSIKRRKGVSQPGGPPHAHQGDIKKILFGYDADAKSVVTGFIRYGASSGAPERLEKGGTVTRDGKRLRYRPRPTMKAAQDAELEKIGGLLKNLIRR